MDSFHFSQFDQQMVKFGITDQRSVIDMILVIMKIDLLFQFFVVLMSDFHLFSSGSGLFVAFFFKLIYNYI